MATQHRIDEDSEERHIVRCTPRANAGLAVTFATDAARANKSAHATRFGNQPKGKALFAALPPRHVLCEVGDDHVGAGAADGRK